MSNNNKRKHNETNNASTSTSSVSDDTASIDTRFQLSISRIVASYMRTHAAGASERHYLPEGRSSSSSNSTSLDSRSTLRRLFSEDDYHHNHHPAALSTTTASSLLLLDDEDDESDDNEDDQDDQGAGFDPNLILPVLARLEQLSVDCGRLICEMSDDAIDNYTTLNARLARLEQEAVALRQRTQAPAPKTFTPPTNKRCPKAAAMLKCLRRCMRRLRERLANSRLLSCLASDS